MVRFLLEFKKHLRPDQEAAFVNLMQLRLGKTRGGMGGPCPPSGPPHGWGRGMGPGPMGPGPHGPMGPPPDSPK
jgi:hypothetical protein